MFYRPKKQPHKPQIHTSVKQLSKKCMHTKKKKPEMSDLCWPKSKGDLTQSTVPLFSVF